MKGVKLRARDVVSPPLDTGRFAFPSAHVSTHAEATIFITCILLLRYVDEFQLAIFQLLLVTVSLREHFPVTVNVTVN